MSGPVGHPATYSDGFIEIFDELIRIHESVHPIDQPDTQIQLRVFDPQAGIGGIHQLRQKNDALIQYMTYGYEIEHEWARQDERTTLGDSTNLVYNEDSFDVICTSPCYGNRMADSHTPGPGDQSKRITYTHVLGRKLASNNGGQLQWGPVYRSLYHKIWEEAVRVLRPDGLFILNCSNHIRLGKEMKVNEWHLATLRELGCDIEIVHMIPTKRMRFGSNSDLRVDAEMIAVLRKKKTTYVHTVIESTATPLVISENWHLQPAAVPTAPEESTPLESLPDDNL